MSVLLPIPTKIEAEAAARVIFRSAEGVTFLTWLLEDCGVLSRQSPLSPTTQATDPYVLAEQKALRDQALLILEMSGVKASLGFLGLPDKPPAQQTAAASPLATEALNG